MKATPTKMTLNAAGWIMFTIGVLLYTLSISNDTRAYEDPRGGYYFDQSQLAVEQRLLDLGQLLILTGAIFIKK